MRLAETERRIMTLVWAQDGSPAKELVLKLKESIGWNKATTYTVISRCIEKGYLRREEPGFLCHALVSREQVAEWETDALISDNYDDRPDLLVASLVDNKRLTRQQIDDLYAMLRELTEKEG